MSEAERFAAHMPVIIVEAACDSRLSPGDLRVLIMLCTHLDVGAPRYIKQHWVASKLCLHPSTVSRSVNYLGSLRYIEIVLAGKNGKTTLYRVCFSPMAATKKVDSSRRSAPGA